MYERCTYAIAAWQDCAGSQSRVPALSSGSLQFIPDPTFTDQWYLTGANVIPVWKETYGRRRRGVQAPSAARSSGGAAKLPRSGCGLRDVLACRAAKDQSRICRWLERRMDRRSVAHHGWSMAVGADFSEVMK